MNAHHRQTETTPVLRIYCMGCMAMHRGSMITATVFMNNTFYGPLNNIGFENYATG